MRWNRKILKTALLLTSLFGSGLEAVAQAYRQPSERSSGAAQFPSAPILQEMTRSAAVIFAGEVLSIRRPAGFAGSASGTVEIVFRIDRAVKGCSSNSTYTLREWSGLWSGGADRYSPGQRLLLFLRGAKADGLSSPVHGAEGAIPLRGGGAAPGPDDTSPAPAEWLVDLRWVQAQAAQNHPRLRQLRPPIHAATMQSAGHSGPTMQEDSPSESHSNLLLRDGVLPWKVETRPAPAETAPLSEILDLCRGWIEETHAAR